MYPLLVALKMRISKKKFFEKFSPNSFLFETANVALPVALMACAFYHAPFAAADFFFFFFRST
jgi:hypothetical protein